jgi:hypothetical protein
MGSSPFPSTILHGKAPTLHPPKNKGQKDVIFLPPEIFQPLRDMADCQPDLAFATAAAHQAEDTETEQRDRGRLRNGQQRDVITNCCSKVS